MSWIQLNVSVTNGSNVVTVNNNLSTAKVRVGDALILSGFQPVEIIGVYANSLTIGSNWENSAQNGAMAAVMPTFGDFDNAAATMRQFTQITQGNFAAMEAWLTQQSGTVTFKGQDGAEHQVRSAKQMDQDVQEKTDAVQAVTNEMVSLVGAQVALMQPDVYIPFNDSLQIVRGYGTHDKIDVSAAQDGSVMVELPTKSVDFSRASVRPHDDKSLLPVNLDVDEPAIQGNGLGIYESYTLHGGRVSSDMVGIDGIDPDLIQTSDIAPDGKTYWMQINNSDNGYVDVLASSNQFVDGEHLVFSCHIKKNSGELRVIGHYNVSVAGGGAAGVNFNSSSGELTVLNNAPVDSGFLEYDGYYRVWVVLQYKDSYSAQGQTLLRLMSTNSTTPKVWGYNVTKSKVLMPYQKVDGNVIIPFSADVASIPMRGNIPSPGKPFTIIVDCSFSKVANAGEQPVIRQPRARTASSGFFIRYQESSRQIQGGVSNGINVPTAGIAVENPDKRRRLALRWEEGVTSLFIDGDMVATAVCETPSLLFNHDISFGSDSSYFLNSGLSEVKFYHRGLTNAEIKAEGPAK